MPFPHNFALPSQQMQQVMALAEKVAPYPSTVLITGETGVGKEVLASYIHQHSERANEPFIKVNCGAIPESLLESELFGYEPGAFTGARREGAQGLFEAADKGTILLDEISELPAKAQSKLLRTLQEREVRRVGGTWSKAVDVRVLAASNQNLWEMVQKGVFRQDLYYRIKVVEIKIPPLRSRREDIDVLLQHFLAVLGAEFNIKKTLSPQAQEVLKNYAWYGNVRELRNAVEALLITTDNEVIGVDDLPIHFKKNLLTIPAEEVPPLKESVNQAERRAIAHALEVCRSTREAAQALEIDYTTLMRKIHKLGIDTRHE